MRLPASLIRRTVQQTAWHIFDPRLPWDVQRKRVLLSTRIPPPPRGTKVEHGEIGGIPCDIVSVGNVLPDRTILHLHGGGFVFGNPRMYRAFAARLSARTMARVVVPDYRLAPEHPWPAAVEDSIAVWSALTAETGTGHRIAVSGDSAGGNLALVVAIEARSGATQPVALSLIAPAVDLDGDHFGKAGPLTDEIMLNPAWATAAIAAYAGGVDLSDPRVSPINADLTGLPPMVIVAAVEEVLAADADRLSKQARAAGVDVIDVRGRGMWHCYPLQAGVVAEADHALMRIATFLNAGFGQS